MLKIFKKMSSRRIERCYTDNIYLIESLPPDSEDETKRIFVIMGHSGNVYNVTISTYPHCTCPDFYLRGNRCKHIYFVLMRIMNIDNYTDRSYTDEELIEMFSNIPPVARELMYKGSAIPNEGKEVEQRFEEGDICPICLDPLENGKDLDFCRYSCGKTIHSKCFSMWEKSKGSICVFCRAQWHCSNLIFKNHKKVAMHPNEINNDNNNDNNNNMNNNIEGNEEEHEMDLDEEEGRNININKKEKKRKKSRSRDKSRSKSRNKSRDKSRGRDKSKNRSRDKYKNKKKKKNYNYPKD